MASDRNSTLAFAAPATRFHVLDGMRGIAALAIVFYHYLDPTVYPFLADSYVAVDLFFILSGFVIFHSYGRKIRQGMRAGAFINARYSRFAPTVAVGVLLGAFATLVMNDAYGRDINVPRFILVHLGHFLFMPDFIDYTVPPNGIPQLFPSNGPLWSIFFEFIASIGFIWLARWPRWALILGSLVCFVTMVLGCAYLTATTDVAMTPNVGWSHEHILLGFPRVFAAFMAGMAIYSIVQEPSGVVARWFPVQRGIIPAIATYAATMAVLWFPFKPSWFYPFIAIGLLSPLLILTGARMAPTARWFRTLSDWLGQLSFPLYCVHIPVRKLTQIYLVDLSWRVQILLSVALALLISFLILKLLDWVRARQRLSMLLKPVTG